MDKPAYVYVVCYWPENAPGIGLAFLAIFAERPDADAYVVRTTTEGSKPFAHLRLFVSEQKVY